MKKHARLAFTFALAAMIYLVVVACTEQDGRSTAHAAGGSASGKWEYAELLVAAHGYFFEGPGDVYGKGKSAEELAKAMGWTIKQTHTTALLNAVGEDGWELVSHVYAEGYSYAAWTFKRPK